MGWTQKLTQDVPLRPLALRAVIAMPAMIATYVFLRLTWIRRQHGDFVSGCVWGLVLLVSYVGWGRLFLQWLSPGRRRGWGLDGAFGLALSVAAGGVMMMLHVAHLPEVSILTGGGLAAFVVASFREPNVPFGTVTLRRASRRWNVWLAYGLFAIPIALRYVGSVANISFNTWDDNMAYRGFAQQVLDTGTLIEPFSYHRVGSYCGMSFLHAMALVMSGPTRLHLVDDGLAVLLLAGLVVGYPRKGGFAGAICALALLVTLPNDTHNIEGQLTGTALFVALFRILDDEAHAAGKTWANAIVVGVVASAVCTLRQNYMAPAAITVVFYYVALAVGQRRERRRWLRETAIVGAVTAAFLLPWAILSFQNARTFLYPIMRGTTNPEFGILGKVNRYEELRWIIDNMAFCAPVRPIALFMLAGLVAVYRRRSLAMHATMVGALIGFYLLIHFFQAFHLADSLTRYYFAFGFGFTLVVTLKTAEEVGKDARAIAPLALVLGGVVVQIVDAKDKASSIYNTVLNDVEDELKDRAESKRMNDLKPLKDEDFYRRMQAAVPPGQRVLVMVDETYRFDGKRNPVWNYDQPGGVSPRPGVPYFAGAEAYARYFESVGVRYLAFVVSNSSPEYSVSAWTARLNKPEEKSGRGNMYRNQARFYLDSFSAFTDLAKTRKALFHENDYWVLDLETRIDGK